MFKRIIIPILLVISVMFSSCTGIVQVKKTSKIINTNTNKSNSVKIDKSKLDKKIKFSPYYKKISLTAGYDTLESESERLVYKEILAHCTDFTDEKESSSDTNYKMESFIVHCSITRRQLAKSLFAVFQDNPQLFWLDEPYAYSISDNYVSIRLYATMTEAEYNKKMKQLNAVINTILSKLKKGMSEFELELYFHDYLVKNCKYLKDSENKEDPYSIYGCLVNQSAVCMGYTSAFQLLLSYVGIESVTVNGSNTDSGHIWNAVKIEGDWYYTDVTWDDTGDFFMYDNFNITTKQLKKTHKLVPKMTAYSDDELFSEDGTIKTVNLVIPKCTATKYNYYKYKGSVLSDISDNNMAEDLAKAAKNREEYFYIYVDPDTMNYKMTYNRLFDKNIFGFSDYIKEANSILGSEVLMSAVTVTKKKDLNTITVELQYI
ncbi:MAG: hypothetical protein J1E41_04700 [Ruminococcus sp.]|nr:hypothetical protein [Ruminococcus sp.]